MRISPLFDMTIYFLDQACFFCIISEKLEVLSELVNPINVTNQTFIMKHRPVALGWRVTRTSIALCTCTRVGHNLCNPNELLLSFMSTYELWCIGTLIGTCRPGHTWALPGLLRIMRILVSWGPDAKARGRQLAYVCTDVRMPYSVVTKCAFRKCTSNAA